MPGSTPLYPSPPAGVGYRPDLSGPAGREGLDDLGAVLGVGEAQAVADH